MSCQTGCKKLKIIKPLLNSNNYHQFVIWKSTPIKKPIKTTKRSLINIQAEIYLPWKNPTDSKRKSSSNSSIPNMISPSIVKMISSSNNGSLKLKINKAVKLAEEIFSKTFILNKLFSLSKSIPKNKALIVIVHKYFMKKWFPPISLTSHIQFKMHFQVNFLSTSRNKQKAKLILRTLLQTKIKLKIFHQSNKIYRLIRKTIHNKTTTNSKKLLVLDHLPAIKQKSESIDKWIIDIL